MVETEFGGSLERLAAIETGALRKRLLALGGVGPETADAILLYALGHAVPVADEYLRRIAERHGLLAGRATRNRSDYETLARLLEEAFVFDPAEDRLRLLNEAHALIVAVGKQHCRPSPACHGCPLAGDAHEQTAY
jgi:endonuclease-3 related protein